MKLFVKIVSILVGLIVLAAVVFLVPPHLQVRRVEPELPSEAELRSLLSIPGGPVSVRYINTSEQALPAGRLGHSVVLIEWANGDAFMIDAGMDRAAAAEFGELMETALGAGAAESHGPIGELLGEDVLRVEGVGFTHLHIDHVQGLGSFCESRGVGADLYQTKWQAEEHNFNTSEGAEIVAESCLGSGELGGGPLMSVEGFPGLGVVALGGHTPGSTLFVVAQGEYLWLFSGDTTNSRSNLLSNTGKGFVYSYMIVPENTARTRVLREWFSELDANEDMSVVVSHDIDAMGRLGLIEYGAR